MPELPEVETVVNGLKKNFINLKIIEFKIIDKNLRYKVPEAMSFLFKNKKIKNILRRGKYGVIILDGNFHILFHLGMTGKYRFTSKRFKIHKHDHIVIKFNNKLNLVYNDVRKFGFFEILRNPIDLLNFKKLGPEPHQTKYNNNLLWKKIKASNQAIKDILLDQSFLAGIGNIYASEILFDCKVFPFKKGKNINKKLFLKLLLSVEKILNKAISKGGVTIRDYKNLTGELGYFKQDLKVYGREGLSCYKCKSLIIKTKRKGRSTYFCEVCQT